MFRFLSSYLLTFIILFHSGMCLSAPLGQPGTRAEYKLDADPMQRPDYEKKNKLTVMSASLALGPVKQINDKSYQWYELSFTRLNGQSYTLWILLDSWPKSDHTPSVADYLWIEPNWPDAVAYVHESTGKPVLPRWSLWHYGWPQESGTDPLKPAPITGFPETIQLQGWSFTRTSLDTNAQVDIPEKRSLVKLNPDLIIGFASKWRDTEGRHHESIPDGKYEYVDASEEDLRKDLEAGLNMRLATRMPDWKTWRSNTYITNYWSEVELPFDDWPAHLYRSNFWGRAFFIDEPGIYHAYELGMDEEAAGKITPAEAARILENKAPLHMWEKEGNYSAIWINYLMDKQFGRGNMYIVEHDYPVWELIWHTAWYQLAPPNSSGGIVDEDINPELMVEDYNIAFGTQIPPTVENACAIKTAVVRGACRNFNKKWGTSTYAYSLGALQPKIDSTSLKCMYDAGATYFWFWFGWPGLTDAQVPYPYKRAYASSIRQFYNENPNRDMDALLKAAKVCIVIPYGYTFMPGPLQRVQWLHLEHKTPAGVTYRQVLSNAALEAERLIRSGIKFDIAVDEPRFKPNGYDELIYIREDGTLKIVQDGKPDRILDKARMPERPDLGPAWKISVKVDEVSQSAPGTAKLSAAVVPGVGELTRDYRNDLDYYFWEIYTPDGGYMSSPRWFGPPHRSKIFSPPGQPFILDDLSEGDYRVRVSIVDVFGRPSSAEIGFHIGLPDIQK